MLEEAGEEPDLISERDGLSPLAALMVERATRFGCGSEPTHAAQLETVRVLLKAGANPNLGTVEDGQIPLTLALAHGQVGEEVVELLLEGTDLAPFCGFCGTSGGGTGISGIHFEDAFSSEVAEWHWAQQYRDVFVLGSKGETPNETSSEAVTHEPADYRDFFRKEGIALRRQEGHPLFSIVEAIFELSEEVREHRDGNGRND